MEDSNKYYQSRHFLRLLHRYEKAISEGQVPYMEADELTDIAEYYMTGKQDDKANQAIQAAIDMHPDSVDPQIFLARQKMYYGKLDEAHDIVDAITEQDDCEVLYLRAELLIKEGDPNGASDFLQQQMSLMQDSLDTYLYDCVSIFMDYDQWEQARQWLDRLRSSYPSHPSIPIMEAEIEMGLDNYEDALTLLKQIIDTDPFNIDAWDLLAETHVALEQIPEALEAADYALAINPQDSSAILMKGNAHMHEGLMAEAIDCYTRYLEFQPDDLSVQISLSICYTNEERYKEALTLLQKAEQAALQLPDRKEDLAQILQLKAFSLSHLGRTDEALALADKSKEYCNESQLWKCFMTMSDILLRDGRDKEAEQNFALALEKSSDKPETLFQIALCYSNAGRYDASIELLGDVWTLYGTDEGKFVVPYLANCYLHKYRESFEPTDTSAGIGKADKQKQSKREKYLSNFLLYLQLAPQCDREATVMLFHDRFPGVSPEDYYAYAYKEIYGVFPSSRDEEAL